MLSLRQAGGDARQACRHIITSTRGTPHSNSDQKASRHALRRRLVGGPASKQGRTRHASQRTDVQAASALLLLPSAPGPEGCSPHHLLHCSQPASLTRPVATQPQGPLLLAHARPQQHGACRCLCGLRPNAHMMVQQPPSPAGLPLPASAAPLRLRSKSSSRRSAI
jgi:hypothetical protein